MSGSIREGRYKLVRTYFQPDKVIIFYDDRGMAIDEACKLCYQKCVDEIFIIDAEPMPLSPEIIRVDREGQATVIKKSRPKYLASNGL